MEKFWPFKRLPETVEIRLSPVKPLGVKLFRTSTVLCYFIHVQMFAQNAAQFSNNLPVNCHKKVCHIILRSDMLS